MYFLGFAFSASAVYQLSQPVHYPIATAHLSIYYLDATVEAMRWENEMALLFFSQVEKRSTTAYA